MSYPYGPPPQQPGWGPAPQQPQQGGWQQPPAPQQPGGWGPPAPGGWQQPQPTQPQWGVPQQQAPEPPAPVQGSLADYFAQPSTGGGAALKFPQNGSAHFGIVNRVITDADTEQQTGIGANANVGQTFKDGRPKLVLKVPLNVRPSQDHTDGKARLYANPGVRDQLVAAVAASGAPIITHPSGVQYYLPEPGSGIYIQKTSTRPTGAGMNPANVFTVQYFRPEQARALAQQQGVEYPTVAELAQTADPTPAPEANQPQPAPPIPNVPGHLQGYAAQVQEALATPPGPPPSTADFAPPTPGQPGNPAQWSQQPAAQQFPQAPGQFPAWGAVDGQQGAPQGPPPQAPQQPGPGAPPPVDWATQGQPQPNGGGYIPQATPPADLAPGLTAENQQLLAGLTGRAQQ